MCEIKKICTKCKIEKDINEFSKNKNFHKNNYVNYKCKSCSNSYNRSKYVRKTNKKPLISLTKYCFSCKLDKELIEFSKNNFRKDGLQICCKSCNKIDRQNKKEIQAKYMKSYHKSYIPKTTEKQLAKYIKNGRIKERIKYNEDIQYKLRRLFLKRISKFLKLFNLDMVTTNEKLEFLGSNIDDFLIYMEQYFNSKINWNTYTKNWVIKYNKSPNKAKNLDELIDLLHYRNLSVLIRKKT